MQSTDDTQPYPHRWKALIVLALSLLVVSLDNTILNVALPTIREEVDATSSQLQWIVDSYMLVFAVLLLIAGTLGDRFGRKKALFTGLIIFAVGSSWAAMSDTSTELIAARALMGVGAAAIMPTTLSILTNIFPASERPKAIAIWAAVSGMGVAIGPTTGGYLIENFDWSWIFLVNLPIVAGGILAGWKLIPESKDPESPRLDLIGAGLSVVSLTALVWAIIEAPERGWTDSVTLIAFGVGLVFAAVFFAWERRSSHPMIDVSVFRNMRFSAASASIAFVFFALMGVIYFLTTYLQTVLGYSALEAGERMIPVAVGLIPAAKMSVELVKRIGTKLVVAGGLTLVAFAMSAYIGAGVDTGYGRIAIALVVMGFGMGLTMSPATEAIMGALPKAKAGIGSAMNDVVREVGGTLGVAILGSVLSTGYASGMDGDALGGLTGSAADAATDSVGGAHQVAAQVGGDAGAHLVSSANAAFVDAMNTTATVAAGVALAGVVVALAFLPARERPERKRVSAALPEPTAA